MAPKVSILRRIWRRLKAVAPRADDWIVLARDLRLPVGAPTPEHVRLSLVERTTDPDYARLLEYSAFHGINRNWCEMKIAEGCMMVLAIDDAADRVGGAAWMAMGRHGVDPVMHDLEPGPRGCQLLNCYIDKPYRGRRLQRHFARSRLARAAQLGRHTAYTVILANNTPSVRNSMAEGFVFAARIQVVRCVGLTLYRMRTLTHRLPPARFVGRGIPSSPFVHLVLSGR